MNKFRFAFQAFALVGLFFAFSVVADAQATRTWVSGVGDDVNPCSRTAPCKTFAGAISKTAANGEINCLDPGGFGTITITKSITIDCTDVPGSILAAGANGVIINSSTAVVRIRGLTIFGAGTGINGIRILSAATVFVEDVVIDGFSQHGVSVETSTGLTKIVISRATISNNAGNGFNTFLTGGASASLSVNGSLFAINNIGFNLGANVSSAFEDSIITGNNTGVLVNAGQLLMDSCQVSNNGVGVQAGSGGTIRISGNTITGNTTGLMGSTIISSVNNVIRGNAVNGAPTSNEVLN